MQQFLIVVELLLLNFVNSMRFQLNMQQTCIIACGGPLGIFIIFFVVWLYGDPHSRTRSLLFCVADGMAEMLKLFIELEGMEPTSGLNGLLECL